MLSSLQKNKIFGLGFMSFGPWTLEDLKVLKIDIPLKVVKYALDKLPPDYSLLLDTAQYYGVERGANEKLLGKLLGQLTFEERRRIIIITKGGVTHFVMQREDEEHNLHFPLECRDFFCEDAETMNKSWFESRKNLQLDKYAEIRVGYLIHRRHFSDQIFYKQLDVLSNLLSQSEIDFSGISEVSLSDLRKANALFKSRGQHLNFLESEFSPNVKFLIEDGFTKFCDSNGIIILGHTPLARGFWSSKDITAEPKGLHSHFEMFQGENYEKLKPMLERIRDYSKNCSISVNQLVLSWILSKGIIPIPGSGNFDNSKNNIDCSCIQLTEDQIKYLDENTFDMSKKWQIKRYA